MPHRRTWQKAEQRAAAIFGCLRNPGSGSEGRPDKTASDSTHEKLYIETKSHARHAARTLHDRTRELARRERKVPVLMLADRGRPGFLVVVHSDDLDAFVRAYLGKDGRHDDWDTFIRAHLGEIPATVNG